MRSNWSFNRTLCGGPSLGSKSLAQIPARHNGPVSSNVRPHRNSTAITATYKNPATCTVGPLLSGKTQSHVGKNTIEISSFTCLVNAVTPANNHAITRRARAQLRNDVHRKVKYENYRYSVTYVSVEQCIAFKRKSHERTYSQSSIYRDHRRMQRSVPPFGLHGQ